MGSEGGDRETMWTLSDTKCALISDYVPHEVWLYLFQSLNFHEITLQILFLTHTPPLSLNQIAKDSNEC